MSKKTYFKYILIITLLVVLGRFLSFIQFVAAEEGYIQPMPPSQHPSELTTRKSFGDIIDYTVTAPDFRIYAFNENNNDGLQCHNEKWRNSIKFFKNSLIQHNSPGNITFSAKAEWGNYPYDWLPQECKDFNKVPLSNYENKHKYYTLQADVLWHYKAPENGKATTSGPDLFDDPSLSGADEPYIAKALWDNGKNYIEVNKSENEATLSHGASFRVNLLAEKEEKQSVLDKINSKRTEYDLKPLSMDDLTKNQNTWENDFMFSIYYRLTLHVQEGGFFNVAMIHIVDYAIAELPYQVFEPNIEPELGTGPQIHAEAIDENNDLKNGFNVRLYWSHSVQDETDKTFNFYDLRSRKSLNELGSSESTESDFKTLKEFGGSWSDEETIEYTDVSLEGPFAPGYSGCNCPQWVYRLMPYIKSSETEEDAKRGQWTEVKVWVDMDEDGKLSIKTDERNEENDWTITAGEGTYGTKFGIGWCDTSGTWSWIRQPLCVVLEWIAQAAAWLLNYAAKLLFLAITAS